MPITNRHSFAKRHCYMDLNVKSDFCIGTYVNLTQNTWIRSAFYAGIFLLRKTTGRNESQDTEVKKNDNYFCDKFKLYYVFIIIIIII